MPIYDLLLKFEGLKAACAGGMTDFHIGHPLFGDSEPGDRRTRLSKLKSAEHPLTPIQKAILTEEFNSRLAGLLPGANQPLAILRVEDWDRPLHEFFGQIARKLEDEAPDALDRAHGAILLALDGLAEVREKDHALAVERYEPAARERYRIPVGAKPIDPLDLPPALLKVGDQMAARLTRPVADYPTRGWLFYVRNPDTRAGARMIDRAWDQALDEFVFWHAETPFELEAGFVGLLPGFPATVSNRTGAVTAYLVLEALPSHAMSDLLGGPSPGWRPSATPSFDGFAHMVTCRRKLFQVGNVKRSADENLPIPRLFTRRYEVSA